MVTERVGTLVTLAAILEAMAEKPGNVTPTRPSKGASYRDYLLSSIALGCGIDSGIDAGHGVGGTAYSAVDAFLRAQGGGNTHLGVAVLLTPLAMGLASLKGDVTLDSIREAATSLVREAGPEETVWMDRAIKLAHPTHLPPASGFDALDDGTEARIAERGLDLVDWMAYGEERNLLAREYTTGFEITFGVATPDLLENLGSYDLDTAIIRAYVNLVSLYTDTNVLGAGGARAAREARKMARAIVEAGYVQGDISRFDAWLRERDLNPGTCADFMAGALFLWLACGGR